MEAPIRQRCNIVTFFVSSHWSQLLRGGVQFKQCCLGLRFLVGLLGFEVRGDCPYRSREAAR